MKLFMSSYANMLEVPQALRGPLFGAAAPASMPTADLGSKRYLSSECRAFEAERASGNQDIVFADVDTSVLEDWKNQGQDLLRALNVLIDVPAAGLLHHCRTS